jgi:hypothetical protein
VAVQVAPAAWLYAGDGYQKADHSRTVIGAEYLPADFRRDDEQANRKEFDILESPDLLLQPNGLDQVRGCRQ